MTKFIGVLFLGLLFNQAVAEDTLMVEDLRPAWIFHSGDEWIPFTNTSKTQIVSFKLDLEDYNGYLMKIKSAHKIDIWLNEHLLKLGSRNLVINLDTLIATDKSECFIHLTSSTDFIGVETSIVNVIPQSNTQRRESGLKKREAFSQQEIFTVFLFFLIGLTGIFRRFFPIKFSQIIAWRPRLRKIDLDENFSGLVTIENLLTIIFGSLLLSSCLVYYKFFITATDFGNLDIFLYFSQSFLMTLTVIGLKMIVSRILAYIFDLRSIYGIQTIEFLNFSTAILILAFGMVWIDYAFTPASHWLVDTGSKIFLITSILFYQLWIYFRLNRITSNTKILIISYLCISEYLPGFLLLVWILW